MKINLLVGLLCLSMVFTKPLDDDNQAQEGDDKRADKRDSIEQQSNNNKANNTANTEETEGSNNVDLVSDSVESSPDQKSIILPSATVTTLLASPTSPATTTKKATTVPSLTTVLPTTVNKGATTKAPVVTTTQSFTKAATTKAATTKAATTKAATTKAATTKAATTKAATTKAATVKVDPTKKPTPIAPTIKIITQTTMSPKKVTPTLKNTPSTQQTVENSKNNTYKMSATTYHAAVRLLAEKYVEDLNFVTSPVYQSLKKHVMQTIAGVYSNYPEFKQIVVIKFTNSKARSSMSSLTRDMNDDKRDIIIPVAGVIVDFYLRFYSSGRHLVPLTRQVINGKIGTVPVSPQFVRAYSAEPKGRVCTPDCRLQCYSYCDSGCCHINVIQHLDAPTQSPVDSLIQQQQDELRNPQGLPGLSCQGPTCDTQVLQQPCSGQSCPTLLENPCMGPSCAVNADQPCQGPSCAPGLPMQQPCQGQSCGPQMSLPQQCQGSLCQPPSIQQQPCQGQFCGNALPMQQLCQGPTCSLGMQNPCIGSQCSIPPLMPASPCQGAACSQPAQFQMQPQFFGLPQMNPSSCPPLCSQNCGPMCPTQCCNNREQQVSLYPQIRCGPQGC